MSTDLARLSLNQATCEHATLSEAIEACVAHQVPHIGVWRHKLEGDSEEIWGKRIRDAGLGCSSLCRGGMFPAATAEERRRHIEDNLKAIDQAVGLGTDLLVLVCAGPLNATRPSAASAWRSNRCIRCSRRTAA